MNRALNEIGASVSLREATTSREVFVDVCRFMVLGDSTPGHASRLAESQGRRRAAEILKSPAQPATLNGSALTDFGTVAAAWLDALKSVSVFDNLWPWMLQTPLSVRVGVTSLAASGYVRGEGNPRQISSLSVAVEEMTPRNVCAYLVLTRELAQFAGSTGGQLFDRELRAAVGSVTDDFLISILTSGITPFPSSGSTVVSVRTDLSVALSRLALDARSKIFILVTSKIAKSWSMSNLSDGGPAFPEMSPVGGVIQGMTVLVSSAVADGTIVMVDAAQIAAAQDRIELRSLKHASLDVSAPPDSPATAATTTVNLFQENKVGLSAERYLAARRLGASSVAIVNEVAYSGDSPAT